jgi:hypothetical protein
MRACVERGSARRLASAAARSAATLAIRRRVAPPHPLFPSPPPPAQLQDALQQRAWGLRRLNAVLALLEARLTDIVKRWESGELRRAGLGLGEVRRLVCAVFESTDLRAQCLQRIEVADA